MSLKSFINKITTAKNNAGQVVKKKVVNTVNKVTTAKNNAGQKIGKTLDLKGKLKNLASSKGFIVLAPYKQLMRKVLKLKGHNISNTESIKTVALLFYSVVVLKKNSFQYQRYTGLSRSQFLDESDKDLLKSVAVSSAPNIIKAILDFIKGIRDKKNAGNNLTEDETVVATDDTLIEKDAANGNVDLSDSNEAEQEGFFARIWHLLFGKKKQNFRSRIDRRNVKVKPKVNVGGGGGGGGVIAGGGGGYMGGNLVNMGFYDGNSIIESYEYNQSYANRVQNLAGSTGTLRPLVRNSGTSAKETKAEKNRRLFNEELKKLGNKLSPGEIKRIKFNEALKKLGN